MRRAALALLLITAAALAAAPSASAGIWTPVASNTTEDITAVDQRGPGDVLYATANGKIFRNGVQQLSAPGVSFTDIALNPSGTVGLASAANGRLYRSTGATWAPVALGNPTRAPSSSSPCGGNATTTTAPVTGNLVAVGWKDDSTAYVPATDEGVVLKTTNGGTNFTDVSRQVDGTCRAGTNDVFSDVSVVPGTDLLYLVGRNFGARFFSSNGLASTAGRRGDTAANCFTQPQRIAVDPANPNRSFVVSGCSGSLQFGFSADAGVSYDISLDYVNGSGDDLSGLSNVSLAGGSALAVGKAGAILVSPDGVKAYFQRADGIDLTTDWFAADKSTAGDAAVGGRGGRLITTTQANTIPDVVKPAGTITGPAKAVVGQPTTFTANVADNAGGSGINQASFAWSATGLPGATGNPVRLTFPSAGFYTVTVTFADRAGNAGTASFSLQAEAPTTLLSNLTTPPANLEAARAAYLAVRADEQVDAGWTGSSESCSVGVESPASLEATLRTVNTLRRFASVGPVKFDDALNRNALAAALMMRAAGRLSHAPQPGFPCYSEDGVRGAGASNLFLGLSGAAAMVGYVDDGGVASLGHRRWLLDPSKTVFGSGSTGSSNALNVVTGQRASVPPNTGIAWPPPGWVPWPWIFNDWSVAVGGDGQVTNLSGAQVRVTVDGRPVPVSDVVALGSGAGTGALLKWRVQLDKHLSSAMHAIGVGVTGVIVDGREAPISWTTQAFPGESVTQSPPPKLAAPAGPDVRIGAIRLTSRSSRLQVRLSCTRRTGICSGHAKATIRGRSVARAYAVRASGAKIVSLKLSSRMRRRFAAKGRVSVQVSATTSSKAVVTRRIRLRGRH